MDKIQWHAPEYIHTDKTADWYWIVCTITVSIILIAIILENLIFGLLIAVSAFTLTLFASRKPLVVPIEINSLGVNVGDTHYPLGNLESFWVETRDRHHRVLIKSKKTLMPYIVILIDEVSPESVREVLAQYLPEEEHSEPLLEKILIYFGF